MNLLHYRWRRRDFSCVRVCAPTVKDPGANGLLLVLRFLHSLPTRSCSARHPHAGGSHGMCPRGGIDHAQAHTWRGSDSPRIVRNPTRMRLHRQGKRTHSLAFTEVGADGSPLANPSSRSRKNRQANWRPLRAACSKPRSARVGCLTLKQALAGSRCTHRWTRLAAEALSNKG